MKKIIPLLLLAFVLNIKVQAQMEQNEYVQEGEFGITAGLAHYFGDLNNRAAIQPAQNCIGRFL